MRQAYDPSILEKKWQKRWEQANIYSVDLKKKKSPYYCLIMFPYPSGARLHVGHWYQYGPTDSYARFLKMRGHDVFFPMGFDAFGLPAENFAIKTGTPPASSTMENVKNMIEQFRRMGCMYDWSKSLNTSDPAYYRWTQWLFLKMFEKGLAYRKEAPVNFCSKCQTVLAREQCQDGTCERCETVVIQKPLTQWFWKIRDYAERLLEGLDNLDWPLKTKLMQQNWIGKSPGAEIHFKVERHEDHPPWEHPKKPPVITVFTTRPDTLFGATYLVLAPEHSLVEKITTRTQRGHVEAYVKGVKMKNELQRTDLNKEKTGVFTGSYAPHPVTGERIPIWIADYVLMTYGTGAVMAVPAHDERDCAFARKYGLPALCVVKPERARYIVIEKSLPPKCVRELEDFGTVTIQKETSDWGKFFTVEVKQQREQEFIAFLEKHLLTSSDDGGAWYADSLGNTNMVVYPKKNFHIVDDVSLKEARAYGLSLGIPAEQVNFDFLQNQAFTTDGICVNSDFLSGLPTHEAKKRMIAWLEDEEKGREVTTYRLHDWLVSRQRYWGAPIPIVYDPEGNPHPVPEKHLPWLLPTDVEFKPTGESPLKHSKEFKERTEKIFGKGWTPEFDTMDTFVCSSFYFLRFLMEGDQKDFVDKACERKWLPVSSYIGGPEHACMHLIYARFVMMALKDFGVVSHEEPFKKLVHQGLITNKGAKMSKSKGNVVDPDPLVQKYGSDVFRMYLMFMGPYTDGGDWSETGIKGIERFTQRIWKLYERGEKEDTKDPKEVLTKLHVTVKRVTEDMEQLHFNTAISALMEFLNVLEAQEHISRETLKTFAILLAPLAPHLAEELWEKIHEDYSLQTTHYKLDFVFHQPWPHYDPKLLVSSTMTIVIQVNGKVRANIELPADATKESIIAAAKRQENVSKYLGSAKTKKEVYVPGKLVNFVV